MTQPEHHHRHDGYRSRKFWFSVFSAIAIVFGYFHAVNKLVSNAGVAQVPVVYQSMVFALFVLAGVYGVQNVAELVGGGFTAKKKGASEEAPKKEEVKQ